MKANDSAARRRLKAHAKAALWQLLARLAAADVRPFRVRARDKVHELTLAVGPRGGLNGGGAASFPGAHFSPIEAAVWHALAGGPLGGKAIARATGQPYAPGLRTILVNLVRRGVLTHSAGGYARAPAGPGKEGGRKEKRRDT